MADLQTLLSQFLTDLYSGTVGNSAGVKVAFVNGTTASPSITFVSDTDTGFIWEGSGTIDFVANTTRPIQLAGSGVGLASDASILFSTTVANATATKDTGISRTGAGVIAVGNGTPGDVTGTVNATIYKSGANTGVTTFGPAGVTSITVKGGIVTAIS